MEVTDFLTLKLFDFDKGDPKRIQHLMKVHRFAQLIARMEQADAHTRLVVECAALVHDIGIHPAEEKYGRCDGKLQEQEGPAYARPILEEAGLCPEDVERICYLVGHHHTYDAMNGLDYQILVEADFLVNLYEDGVGAHGVDAAEEKIFRTAAGRRLLRLLYPKAENPKPEKD